MGKGRDRRPATDPSGVPGEADRVASRERRRRAEHPELSHPCEYPERAVAPGDDVTAVRSADNRISPLRRVGPGLVVDEVDIGPRPLRDVPITKDDIANAGRVIAMAGPDDRGDDITIVRPHGHRGTPVLEAGGEIVGRDDPFDRFPEDRCRLLSHRHGTAVEDGIVS